MMSVMHKKDVALFCSELINTSEDKISWTRYQPSFISQEGQNTSVQFSIAGNSTQYIDLGKSELYVRIKLEKQDGTRFLKDELPPTKTGDPPATEKVTDLSTKYYIQCGPT